MQRLEAVGRDAEILTVRHQRPPQLDRAIDGVVQLEGHLTCEAEPHDMARHPGDIGLHVLKEPRLRGQPDPLQQLARQRTGDVDRGQRHGSVHHMNPKAPRVDPVAHPHLRVLGTRRREGQHEARLRLPADHSVVDEVPPLVEEQGVARAANPDVCDVRGIEPLQELDHIGPRDHELPERAHITERYSLAHRPVLGDMVAIVPRTPPAPEAIHARAKGDVLVVERGTAEGIDMHAGGRLGKRDLARCRARGERVRGPVRPVGDEGSDVRQAGAALACSEPGQAGALDQLELPEPPIPDTLQIIDGDARAWTDRARGR